MKGGKSLDFICSAGKTPELIPGMIGAIIELAL